MHDPGAVAALDAMQHHGPSRPSTAPAILSQRPPKCTDERLSTFGYFAPAAPVQDHHYSMDDLHLSRLGLAKWTSRDDPIVSPTLSSSTAASSLGSPRSPFSPSSSCASPALASSSIWAPMQSTSKLPAIEVKAPETVKQKKRPKKRRQHICEEPSCGKIFDRTVGLQRHRMTHTGDRPFACDIDGCHRTFVQASALTVHRRVHTGTKPYACGYPSCPKVFADPSVLARHRYTHTGEILHCQVVGCEASFRTKSSFDKHRAEHAEDDARMSQLELWRASAAKASPVQSPPLVLSKSSPAGAAPLPPELPLASPKMASPAHCDWGPTFDSLDHLLAASGVGQVQPG